MVKLPPPVSERAADPLIGQTIDGRYFVEALLGEGGMGVVYAARHAIIDKRVAIKVLRRGAARRERRRSASSSRPRRRRGSATRTSSTSPTSACRPTGIAYFVMEYLDGPTLGKLIRRPRPLPAGARDHHRSADRARPRRRARQGHHPSRSQAREHVPASSATATPDFVKIVDFGIAKDVEAGANEARPDAHRHGARHARVHVARAGDAASRAITASTSTRSAASSTRC